MKITILGSTGLLGKTLYKEGKKRNLKINGISRKNKKFVFDFRKTKNLINFLNINKPNIIINAVGIVDIDKCQNNPNLAYKINALPLKFLAEYTKKEKIKLIQISTDHFFSDKKNMKHSEKSKVKILNIYAKTKYQAEKFTKINNNHIIVRTNFTGFKNEGNMKTFIEWVIENSKKKIALFDDYFCSTIDVKSLANFILDLLNTNFKGIINIGSSSISNKKKFAEKFIKKLGIKNIKIERKSVKTLSTKRANTLGLKVDLIEKTIKKKMPSINKVINNLFKEYKNDVCKKI